MTSITDCLLRHSTASGVSGVTLSTPSATGGPFSLVPGPPAIRASRSLAWDIPCRAPKRHRACRPAGVIRPPCSERARLVFRTARGQDFPTPMLDGTNLLAGSRSGTKEH